jgi:hypothetical protein
MNANIQTKRSRGLSIILVFFELVYALGTIYLLLSWFGIQFYDPNIWQHNSLPFYALVFLVSAISIFGIWKWKKWGVYGLTGSWVITGILNLVFVSPTPAPYSYTFVAVLLVITLFLLLLPAWQNME